MFVCVSFFPPPTGLLGGVRLGFIVQPQCQPAQRRSRKKKPGTIPKIIESAVVGTDSYANGTFGILTAPEFETGFRVGRPFGHAFRIGGVNPL